jgi:hypothetical protein
MVEKTVRGPGREGKQTWLARKPKLDSRLKTLAIRLWLQKATDKLSPPGEAGLSVVKI